MGCEGSEGDTAGDGGLGAVDRVEGCGVDRVRRTLWRAVQSSSSSLVRYLAIPFYMIPCQQINDLLNRVASNISENKLLPRLKVAIGVLIPDRGTMNQMPWQPMVCLSRQYRYCSTDLADLSHTIHQFREAGIVHLKRLLDVECGLHLSPHMDPEVPVPTLAEWSQNGPPVSLPATEHMPRSFKIMGTNHISTETTRIVFVEVVNWIKARKISVSAFPAEVIFGGSDMGALTACAKTVGTAENTNVDRALMQPASRSAVSKSMQERPRTRTCNLQHPNPQRPIRLGLCRTYKQTNRHLPCDLPRRLHLTRPSTLRG